MCAYNDNAGPVGEAFSRRRGRARLRRVLGAVLKYGIPPAVSVALCWLLLRDFDLRGMWQVIRRDCLPLWLLLNLSLGVGAMLFRALRWRLQLRALAVTPGLWQVFLSVMGTYSVNLVFPRLGEVWRTGYIAERADAPFSKVFGSMVADRLADTVAVFLITLLTFCVAAPELSDYFAGAAPLQAKLLAIAGSPVLWGCLAAVCVASAALFMRFRTSRVVKRCRQIVKRLWEGFAVVATMRGRGLWLLYTCGIWACYMAALWAAFMSMPLTRELLAAHPVALAVCFVLTSLSMAVPSNGGIGPWQWAMMFGLGFYRGGIEGFTIDYSALFANLVMGIQTIFLILQGIFTFVWIALQKRHKS